jgi:hypothetical protein
MSNVLYQNSLFRKKFFIQTRRTFVRAKKIVVFSRYTMSFNPVLFLVNPDKKKMNAIFHILNLLKKAAAACIVVAILSSASCSSSFLQKAGWEGIRGSTLRVYVALDIPEDIGPGPVTGRMKDPLLIAGKKRAMILLSAYIREKISYSDRAEACRNAIDGIVNTGKLIDHDCGEDSCTAIIDFTMDGCYDTDHGSPHERGE